MKACVSSLQLISLKEQKKTHAPAVNATEEEGEGRLMKLCKCCYEIYLFPFRFFVRFVSLLTYWNKWLILFAIAAAAVMLAIGRSIADVIALIAVLTFLSRIFDIVVVVVAGAASMISS